MMLPRKSLVLCLARQLSTDLESPEISCRQENSQSAFSVVACILWTLVPLCLTHPSLRTASGWDVVSENIRSVSVLYGHRLCRDIPVVLIASIAIWIPDILFSF